MSSVVNIVAVSSVTLKNTKISLPELLKLDRHSPRTKRPYLAKYKTGRSRNKFSGFFIELTSATPTIFKSGKIIINGIKRTDHLVKIYDEMCQHLRENLPSDIDFDVHLPRVVNITGCRRTGKQIDLNKLAENDACASYEPEIFPNVQYSVQDGLNVKGIISKSGCIVITGVTAVAELDRYLDKLQEIIQVY